MQVGSSFSLGLCISRCPFTLPGRVVIVILQNTPEGKWAPLRLYPLPISRKHSLLSWGQLSEHLCTFFLLDLQVKGESVLQGRLTDPDDHSYRFFLLSLWFNQSPSWSFVFGMELGGFHTKNSFGRTPSLQKHTRNRTVLTVLYWHVKYWD